MIVIDATVAVKLVSREPGAEAALARIVKETDRLAPNWIRIEVANALAKKVRRDGLPPDVAMAAVAHVNAYLTETVEALDLLDEAFELALRLGHAVYDCIYLALAIRRGAVVITHDAEFAKAAQRAGWAGRVDLLR